MVGLQQIVWLSTMEEIFSRINIDSVALSVSVSRTVLADNALILRRYPLVSGNTTERVSNGIWNLKKINVIIIE